MLAFKLWRDEPSIVHIRARAINALERLDHVPACTRVYFGGGHYDVEATPDAIMQAIRDAEQAGTAD